ncbi:Alpha beta hydrolase fold family protein [Rutstroemia sp. NJR-2017a BVV2]|nr:Alpha beta hydrolase fold family protein [Rutstroemia sp. NJR-2017a BVV2]
MANEKRLPTASLSLSQGSSLIRFYPALLLGGLLLWIWHHGIPSNLLSPVSLELDRYHLPPNIVKKSWKWNDIEASEDLVWHSCFDNFQCARLLLPLDWTDSSKPDGIALAIIKIPATDLSDYRGAVWTNPGGPGGSGIYSLRRNGHNLQKIVGRNHDIISFDPRGIGASTPRLDCWGSKQNENVWKLQNVGLIDSHPGVLYDAYARAYALSGACEETMNQATTGEESLLNYVSTASVARDMLEIMNKMGAQKMKYWGFSYGTYLGGVFAAMYPDKVERLVSDGNVDYLEWSTNTHISFLHDSDKIMEAFYTYCHAAGPRICSFYSPTTTEISRRFSLILSNLKTHPIIVPSADSISLPEIITYSSLKRLISAVFYRPVLLFPSLANVLQSLELGNGAPFVDLVSTFGMRTPFTCDCDSCHNDLGGPDEDSDIEASDDAMAAVMCSDGGEMNDTAEEFALYAEKLIAGAQATGAVNVDFRMTCVGWKAKAKFRFTGPFTGNTSHPILYIVNQADNVTPLRSAIANSDGFPGSVLLVQESYGHTSLTAPSLCTSTHIHNYFQTGVLPPSGTRCKADIEPFGSLSKADFLSASISSNDHNQDSEGFIKLEKETELREAAWELMMHADVRFQY